MIHHHAMIFALLVCADYVFGDLPPGMHLCNEVRIDTVCFRPTINRKEKL
jgi:hypothetical protein